MPEPQESPLLTFVKGLLGFYGSGGDSVLTPLILAAQESLSCAGVSEPTEDEKAIALYNTAVALQVKILHDGDPKGALQKALTAIILQTKNWGGEPDEVPGDEEV